MESGSRRDSGEAEFETNTCWRRFVFSEVDAADVEEPSDFEWEPARSEGSEEEEEEEGGHDGECDGRRLSGEEVGPPGAGVAV